MTSIFYSHAHAADDKPFGSVKGVVLDKVTKQPLPGINVTVDGTRRGTVPGRDGSFIITKVPIGKHTLVYSLVGYATERSEEILVSENETTDAGTQFMVEQPIPLKELIVSAGSYSIMGVEPSRQTLTADDIEMMAWSEDIAKAIQKVPGISGDDFTAKFNIRGGDVDEVLFLIDGMQIYNPFHQKDFGGGLFSTVDVAALQGVDLSTGGFTAEYGDRMSGVLSMRTKKPEPDHPGESSAGLSLIQARGFSTQNFNEGRSSWLLSARRGYLDILNRLTGNEFKLKPTYYDVLGKVEHQVNQQHSVSSHFFLAGDTYNLDEMEFEKGKTVPNIDFSDTEYDNYYGWLTLKSFFRPTLYARSILYAGRINQNRFWDNFDDDPNYHFSKTVLEDNRDFKLYGIKQDWGLEAGKRVFVRFGAELKHMSVDYDYSKDIQQEFILADHTLTNRATLYERTKKLEGNQLGLYLSTRFKVLDPLTLETGMRYDRASYTNDKLWSPRLNAVYALTKTTFLRAGWGHFYQIQSIDGLRLQFEEEATHKAEKSEHYVLGLEHRFANGLYFRTEGYVKNISDVPDKYVTLGGDIDEFYPEARTDLVRLSVDKGAAKGIEIYLKYDTGNKISWWLSYILSEAKDDITAIEYDGPLVKRIGEQSRPWDQKHTLNLDVNYRLNRKWDFNITLHYRSGWAYTDFEVDRVLRNDGSGTFAYFHDNGTFHGTRTPGYQRLDARINHYFYPWHSRLGLYVHVINLYNHQNLKGFDHEVLSEDATTFEAIKEKDTWYGILPFVGMTWEF